MIHQVETQSRMRFSVEDAIQSQLLIIIPAYNEEESIGQVISEIKKFMPIAAILVINDGSMDKTAAIAQQSGADVLNLPYNLGIGGAVRAGYAFADELGYPWVIRLDGDGQHDPSNIFRMLAPVVEGRADAVFGSRFCGDRNCYQPSIARRFGIWLYGITVSVIIRQRIHDATSGLWCVNRKTVRYFKHYFPQDYPEVESHIVLHKAGLRQLELPATMHPRFGGQSSISFLKSIYYSFKVMLALLVRASQNVPQLPEEEPIVLKGSDLSYFH